MKALSFWNKWKYQLICIASGLLLYRIQMSAGSDARLADGYLERNGYGGDPRIYDFVVEGMAKEPLECQVEILSIQYEEQEAEAVFDTIISELPELMRRENPSMTEVRTDLNLPEEFAEYGVHVSWKSEIPQVVDSFGQVQNQDCPEEGMGVCLTADLTDGIHEREAQFYVRVLPETLTREQYLIEVLKEEIREADKAQAAQTEVKLPETYEGRPLSYREKEAQEIYLFPLLGLLAAGLLYARDRKADSEKQKQRKQKLLLDYAEVVYQLMVFTGAGFTINRAWERIVLNYEARRKKKRGRERPAYEEMAVAYKQMQCGEPEGKAISAFGKRCGLQSYLKLSSLLEQNRRTGTKDLQRILENEMSAAWEQQKNVARRMGEEAGTKLLAPLLLMLMVVMVIIMVPAMMSMG